MTTSTDDREDEQYLEVQKERAEVRLAQRQIYDDVVASKAVLGKSGEDNVRVDDLRHRNNESFAQVTAVREALNDSKVLKEITGIVKQQTTRSNGMTLSIDVSNLNNGIIDQFSKSGQFTWSILGYAVGAIITKAPTVNTMVGQVEKEEKVY